MVLLFLCFGLGFLLVVSESHFQLSKVISWFCATIRLNLFCTKFWFGFVCVMHGSWLITSSRWLCFVYVITSCLCKSFIWGGNTIYSFIGLFCRWKWWFCEGFLWKTPLGVETKQSLDLGVWSLHKVVKGKKKL